MDQYSAREPLYARLESTAMKLSATMDITRGDLAFTPLAVLWSLSICFKTNGNIAHFSLVENLMASFLRGKYFQDLGPLASGYYQSPAGFEIQVASGLLDNSSTRKRRYVKRVTINFEFLHAPQSTESLLHQIIVLADYGMACLFHGLVSQAPAIFSSDYAHVLAIETTFSSMGLALGLESHDLLELSAENYYLKRDHARRPAPTWDHSEGKFFPDITYTSDELVVILDSDPNSQYLHVPIFFDELERDASICEKNLDLASSISCGGHD